MINKVILVGNVGIDPEVRAIESGVKVARVRLATTERIFNRQTNESTEHTEWHTVILWRGLADVVDRFVRKGSQLYIEGSLRTREWMDKENQKRYTTEIIASDMKLLGKRSDNPAGGQSAGRNGHRAGGRGRITRRNHGNRTAGRDSAGRAKAGINQNNPSDPVIGGVASFHTLSVGVTGFEPATLWSQTRYATGLRYTPNAAASAGISIKKQTTLSSSLPICRGDWIRTSDLQLPKLAR